MDKTLEITAIVNIAGSYIVLHFWVKLICNFTKNGNLFCLLSGYSQSDWPEKVKILRYSKPN